MSYSTARVIGATRDQTAKHVLSVQQGNTRTPRAPPSAPIAPLVSTRRRWATSTRAIVCSAVLAVVVVVFIDQSEDKTMGPRRRLPLVTPVGEGLNLSKPCSHGRPWNIEEVPYNPHPTYP